MEAFPVSAMVQLGFTPTEARVYCAMAQEEKSSGYQIAKVLGLSRSSVYAALDSLTDKGAIVSIPGGVSEYSVVEPKILIEKIVSRTKKNAAEAEQVLERLSLKRRASNYFCTISGKQNLTEEICSLVATAKKELLINVSMDLAPFVSALKAARERDVRIILFSWAHLDLHGIDAEVYLNDSGTDFCPEQRFFMVVDNKWCITCSNDKHEFIPHADFISKKINLPAEDKDFLGIKSDNRLMVNIIQEHIHFDIYLNKLRTKTGGEVVTRDIQIGSLMERGG